MVMKLKNFDRGNSLILLSVIPALFLMMSCSHPVPIPDDKKDFIGVWYAHSGFKVEINSNGLANLTQKYDSKDSEDIKMNIGVSPDYANGMQIKFKGDTFLTIIQPLANIGKEYHIDRKPYIDNDTMKMILNGVILIKRRIKGV